MSRNEYPPTGDRSDDPTLQPPEGAYPAPDPDARRSSDGVDLTWSGDGHQTGGGQTAPGWGSPSGPASNPGPHQGAVPGWNAPPPGHVPPTGPGYAPSAGAGPGHPGAVGSFPVNAGDSGNRVPVLFIVGLVVLLVGVAGAVYYMRSDDTPEAGAGITADAFTAAKEPEESGTAGDREREDRDGSDDEADADESGRDEGPERTVTVERQRPAEKRRVEAAAPARSRSAGPAGVREAPTDPACDGRGIIIYQSVYGPNAGPELNAALDAHPGTVYASPGACASLNPEKDGYPVYAVYKDYGHDREALCAADTGIETNSRIMQNVREYGDYCGN